MTAPEDGDARDSLSTETAPEAAELQMEDPEVDTAQPQRTVQASGGAARINTGNMEVMKAQVSSSILAVLFAVKWFLIIQIVYDQSSVKLFKGLDYICFIVQMIQDFCFKLFKCFEIVQI